MKRLDWNLKILDQIKIMSETFNTMTIGELLWNYCIPKEVYDLFFPESKEIYENSVEKASDSDVILDYSRENQKESVETWIDQMTTLCNAVPDQRFGQILCNYCIPEGQGNLYSIDDLRKIMCFTTNSQDWIDQLDSVLNPKEIL